MNSKIIIAHYDDKNNTIKQEISNRDGIDNFIILKLGTESFPATQADVKNIAKQLQKTFVERRNVLISTIPISVEVVNVKPMVDVSED